MIITNLAEQRKKEVLDWFFNKFGTLKFPQCMLCIKPVQKMGVDFDPLSDVVIVWVECHGDREEARAPLNFVANQNAIEIRGAFHPKASTRNKGILVKDI